MDGHSLHMCGGATMHDGTRRSPVLATQRLEELGGGKRVDWRRALSGPGHQPTGTGVCSQATARRISVDLSVADKLGVSKQLRPSAVVVGGRAGAMQSGGHGMDEQGSPRRVQRHRRRRRGRQWRCSLVGVLLEGKDGS